MSTKPCRRCSECAHSEHHWIECCEVVDEGMEEGEMIFNWVCKHCSVLGNDCEECAGSGCIDENSPGPQSCPDCRGYGVVPSCLYSEDDE